VRRSATMSEAPRRAFAAVECPKVAGCRRMGTTPTARDPSRPSFADGERQQWDSVLFTCCHPS
jgi:hypothetical protein